MGKLIELVVKPVVLLWRLWVYFLMILWLIIIGPIVYLSTFLPNYSYTHFFIRLWSLLVFYMSGFRYELELKVPKWNYQQQYIIISNHTSMMDIPLMYLLFPKNHLSFVGKKSLVKIPIMGAIYKRVCVMVDRSSQVSKMRVFELTKEKINQKRSMVVFPEGGVPDDRSIVLDKFKDGAFSMAIEHKLPILVLVFNGLKEGFPFQNFIGKPTKIHVKLIEIVPTNDYSIDDRKLLNEKCYNLMRAELDGN